MVGRSSASLNNARASRWLRCTIIAQLIELGSRNFLIAIFFIGVGMGLGIFEMNLAQGYCAAKRSKFWPPPLDHSQNLGWSRWRNAINKTSNNKQIKLRSASNKSFR
jgi:hypothetical protein